MIQRLIASLKIAILKLLVGSQIDRTIKSAKNKEQLVQGLIMLLVSVALETYKDVHAQAVAGVPTEEPYSESRDEL